MSKQAAAESYGERLRGGRWQGCRVGCVLLTDQNLLLFRQWIQVGPHSGLQLRELYGRLEQSRTTRRLDDRFLWQPNVHLGIINAGSLSIGATLDAVASKPVAVRATVRALLQNVTPEKREAAVQIEGITLILSAYRRPYHEIADFTKLGVYIPPSEVPLSLRNP